ncbi:hypothetical protein ABVT39_027964 [Epinephelus coioides]
MCKVIHMYEQVINMYELIVNTYDLVVCFYTVCFCGVVPRRPVVVVALLRVPDSDRQTLTSDLIRVQVSLCKQPSCQFAASRPGCTSLLSRHAAGLVAVSCQREEKPELQDSLETDQRSAEDTEEVVWMKAETERINDDKLKTKNISRCSHPPAALYWETLPLLLVLLATAAVTDSRSGTNTDPELAPVLLTGHI